MKLSLVERMRRKAAHTYAGPSVTRPNAVGSLSITIDDFPRSAWTEGGAVMASHGVKGTYYVSGRLCGGAMDGQEQYRDSDLAALHEAGHEVGCHTFDHVSALKVSSRAYAQSIDANARFFAERLDGWKPVSFAYPYGDVSLGALNTVAARDMTGRVVVGGANTDTLRPLMLSAFPLEAGRPESDHWEAMVEQAAAQRQWLVIVTHDVQDNPSEYGCTPRTLDAVLTAARKAGLQVAPVGAIMEGASASARAA